MAIVQFATTVKYRGVLYAPHIPFEVNDEDLVSLKKDGATEIKNTKSKAPAKVLVETEDSAPKSKSKPKK